MKNGRIKNQKRQKDTPPGGIREGKWAYKKSKNAKTHATEVSQRNKRLILRIMGRTKMVQTKIPHNLLQSGVSCTIIWFV